MGDGLPSADARPLCIDLFCGLGGWAEGFLAEGYSVVGFDVERHRYPKKVIPSQGVRKAMVDGLDFSKGTAFNTENEKAWRNLPDAGGWDEYPGQLVLQDVLTLHGSQFRDAAVIVASPPCQEYSWMAMPFSRGKKRAAEYRDGTRDVADLTRLFDACFRIQREACEATKSLCMVCRGMCTTRGIGGNLTFVRDFPCEYCNGKGYTSRHIPIVVENVKGAQPWVGRAKWHYGSFYLWGDVPALMPSARHFKIAGYSDPRRNGGKGAHLTCQAENDRNKQPVWFNDDKRRAEKCGGDWFGSGPDCSLMRQMSSKSSARKAASAQIAKIPFALANYLARVYRPEERAA